MLARYGLAELDREADLLRIVLAEARSHPELVSTAVDTLIGAAYAGFVTRLRERAKVSRKRADAITAGALGALFSNRLPRLALGRDPIPITDELFVATWVDMVHNQITAA
jgi:hypothetical protein